MTSAQRTGGVRTAFFGMRGPPITGCDHPRSRLMPRKAANAKGEAATAAAEACARAWRNVADREAHWQPGAEGLASRRRAKVDVRAASTRKSHAWVSGIYRHMPYVIDSPDRQVRGEVKGEVGQHRAIVTGCTPVQYRCLAECSFCLLSDWHMFSIC